VIVEKPMATTLEDADALIVACKDAGVLCSCREGGVRYHPATIKAKELIQQGAIGEVMATQVSGALYLHTADNSVKRQKTLLALPRRNFTFLLACDVVSVSALVVARKVIELRGWD
jgi:predicted dehydrogenase